MAVVLKYILLYIWVWRRLVARYLGVVEAVGSSPATQTIQSNLIGLEFFSSYYDYSVFLCNFFMLCLVDI